MARSAAANCILHARILFCFLSVVACTLPLATPGLLAPSPFVPSRFQFEKQHLQRVGLAPLIPNARCILCRNQQSHGRFEDGLNLPNTRLPILPGYKWDGAYDPRLLSTWRNCLCCSRVRRPAAKEHSFRTSEGVWLRLQARPALHRLLWGFQFPVIKRFGLLLRPRRRRDCLLLLASSTSHRDLAVAKMVYPLSGSHEPHHIYLIQLIESRTHARLVAVHRATSQWATSLSLHVVVLMFGIVRFLYNRKIFLRSDPRDTPSSNRASQNHNVGR